MPLAVERASEPPCAASLSTPKSSEPTASKVRNMAIMNPTSPTRLVMNAFFPAIGGSARVCQNDTRK